jgi:hypothetical protein
VTVERGLKIISGTIPVSALLGISLSSKIALMTPLQPLLVENLSPILGGQSYYIIIVIIVRSLHGVSFITLTTFAS